MAAIEKRGSSYRITASVGYSVDGRQIRRKMTWKPTPGMTEKQIKNELERQTLLFEQKCNSAVALDGNITLKAFCEKWIAEYAAPSYAPKTLEGYNTYLPRIYAALGHKKLSQLKPAHIMEFYANLQETGIRGDIKYKSKIDIPALLAELKITRAEIAKSTGLNINTVYQAVKGSSVSPAAAESVAKALNAKREAVFAPVGENKPLSDITIFGHHKLLHAILKTAVKWQYIERNQCDYVTAPRIRRKEAVYLDEVQTAQMLKLLELEPIKPRTMILMLVYSGLRRGELCGLLWSDIDFSRRLLTVRRSSQYVSGHGVFDKETKTTSSNRTIKLPDIAFTVLNEYRRWQQTQRLALGDKWENSDRVFCDDFGKPIRPDYITIWFRKFVDRTGQPKIHIHSLRHTNATLQIAGGVPLRTVSSRLGHSQLSTTGNIYSHAIQSADEAAADVLQDILNPVKKRG